MARSGVEVAQEGALRLHRLVVQFVLGALDGREAQAAVEGAMLVTGEQFAFLRGRFRQQAEASYQDWPLAA